MLAYGCESVLDWSSVLHFVHAPAVGHMIVWLANSGVNSTDLRSSAHIHISYILLIIIHYLKTKLGFHNTVALTNIHE